MRVMVLVKANQDSEAGVLPDHAILTRMLLRRSEERTQNGNDAQHGKQACAHACAVGIFGRPVAGESDIIIDDAGDRGKDIGAAAKFRKILRRRRDAHEWS